MRSDNKIDAEFLTWQQTSDERRLAKGKKIMAERERVCILCGRKEEMESYICRSCQDRIQKEVLGKRREMKRAAEKELMKFGVKPDNKT